MEGHTPRIREDVLLRAADQLSAAAEILVAVSARTAMAVDSRLSPSLLRALTLVAGSPGLSLSAFADRAQISRSRASRVCDSLDRAGLLTRSLISEDRRGISLDLTHRGRGVLDTVRTQRAEWIKDALLRMPDADLRALLTGLWSLGPSLSEALPEQDRGAS
jgi:DNA-binding MarR family transcriptional regulator